MTDRCLTALEVTESARRLTARFPGTRRPRRIPVRHQVAHQSRTVLAAAESALWLTGHPLKR